MRSARKELRRPSCIFWCQHILVQLLSLLKPICCVPHLRLSHSPEKFLVVRVPCQRCVDHLDFVRVFHVVARQFGGHAVCVYVHPKSAKTPKIGIQSVRNAQNRSAQATSAALLMDLARKFGEEALCEGPASNSSVKETKMQHYKLRGSIQIF